MNECPYCGSDESKCNFSFETEECDQMPEGPAVSIMGIWLRREGDCVVVYVEKDGKRYEAIREHYDGPFSHHISEHGLAGLHKLDEVVPQPMSAVSNGQ
jgi:hypothetical protein